METYVALLRGVNVSGRNVVSMPRLKKILLDAGFREVTTLLNSGNVLFRAASDVVARADVLIAKSIQNEFGFDVKVHVLSVQDIRRILGRCPFATDASRSGEKVYVTLLSKVPRPAMVARMKSISDDADETATYGKAVYVLTRRGYASSTFNNNSIEKILQVDATTRNIATLRRIVELGGHGE